MADKKIEKEAFELPNTGAGADIPDLKKKDKERKKAGASWGSAKPTGAPFQGATGGSGVAGGARAAASAARAVGAAGESAVALGAAAQQAGLMGLFSNFAASMVGKVVLGVFAAALVGGAGVALKGGGGSPAAVGGRPDLGGIASTIKVKREGDSGLQHAANAGRQELNYGDKTAPQTVKAEGTQKAEEAQKADATNTDQMDRGAGVKTAGTGDKMAHDMSGSKLSSNISNSFGGKDIFSGSGGAPKFGAALGTPMAKFGTGQGGRSKGATVAKRNTNASRSMQLRGLKTNRSLGQLRSMAPLNSQIRGNGTATEANSAAAATQFIGTEVTGGNVPTAPTSQAGGGGGGGGTGASGGGSAPDTTNDTIEQCDSSSYWNGTSCTSMNQGGKNVTPWQGLVDQGNQLKQNILIMLSIVALIAVIASYWGKTCCSYIGFILWAIALALAAVAVMMSAQMYALGEQIDSMGGQPAGKPFKTAGLLYGVTGIIACVLIYTSSNANLMTVGMALVFAAVVAVAAALDALLK